MTRLLSPLRYPGGKRKIKAMVKALLAANGLANRKFCEPFAGGAGLGLALLESGDIDALHLNDNDPGVFAFWWTVLNQPDVLTAWLATVPVTVENFRYYRHAFDTLIADPADTETNRIRIAKAFLFLNRTSFSGVIKGTGPIGGYEQAGKYRINARFPRDTLRDRIRIIAARRDKITLTRDCASTLIESLPEQSEAVLYLDPPYLLAGPRLYATKQTQAPIAMAIRSLLMSRQQPWFMTIDHDQRVLDLYGDAKVHAFNLHYSLNRKEQKRELLVVSPNLCLPN